MVDAGPVLATVSFQPYSDGSVETETERAVLSRYLDGSDHHLIL